MRDGALTVMAEQRQEGKYLVSREGLASSTRNAWPFHLVRLSLATPDDGATASQRKGPSETRNKRHAEWDVQTAVFSMGLTSTKAKLVPAITKCEQSAFNLKN
jgi:hypothetical protein